MSANTGLSTRVRAFFVANPSEELSKAEMAAKFGYSIRSIEDALRTLKEEGVVTRTIVYRAAPKAVE